MQTFRYEAADAQGRIETGTLEADSQRGALGQLRARGLTPLEVREQAGGGTGQGAGALFAPRLSDGDLAWATRQLASLLAASLPLEAALSATLDGNPSRINIVRTLRSAHARRIALSGGSRAKLRAALKELERIKREEPDNLGDIQELELEIAKLRARIDRVPFLDTFDLKYNLLVKQPNPTSKAVMFCLMDVSGSMTQATKDIAKRFFILLYLFLKRNYEKIEVVFIRHHTSAREVDEEEFFYSRETGGTIVSSALKMMQEIMAERYPTHEWNIYAAQASDGDNWNDDSPVCRDILLKQIMPFVQYYTYVEITPREHQALWFEYERVREAFEDSFAQQQIVSASDIYPVFRELFQRRLVA